MILLINKEEQRKGNGSISRELSKYIKTIDFSQAGEVTKEDGTAIFFGGGGAIKYVYPALKKLPKETKVCFYMADLRKAEDFPRETYGKFDYIFTTYLDGVDTLKPLTKNKKNVFYIPQAGHKYPDTDFAPRIKKDVIFIGNGGGNIYHNNRPEILKFIKNNYKLHHIYGTQTHDINQSYWYKNYPVSLSIVPPFGRGFSNRFVNILASEGLVLTNYFEGLERMFTNYKDIIWFKDLKELEGALKFIFKHPEVAIQIKANGLKLYEKYYNGAAVLNNIEEMISGEIKEFKGFIYERD